MKYTKKERTQMATALRQCKKFLRDGKEGSTGEDFICIALMDTDAVGNYMARAEICSRLGDMETVECWLSQQKLLGSLMRHSPASRDRQVQQYRHRWVNALIKEFSA